MYNKLLSSILTTILIALVLLISSIFIKFDYSQVCSLISNNGSYSIAVNKKVNNFIKKNNIKKIYTEIDNRNWTFNLYYNSFVDSNFYYWANPTLDSFSLEQGTYSLSFNFGKINFISYIF